MHHEMAVFVFVCVSVRACVQREEEIKRKSAEAMCLNREHQGALKNRNVLPVSNMQPDLIG